MNSTLYQPHPALSLQKGEGLTKYLILLFLPSPATRRGIKGEVDAVILPNFAIL
jgi:hypothetical protein